MSAAIPTIDLIPPRGTAPIENVAQQMPTQTPEINAGLPVRRQRFVFLDGLRGLACLRIVGYHLFTEPSFHTDLTAIVPKRVPFFPVYWYAFFLGVLICWSFEGQVSRLWFWAYVVGTSAGFVWRHNPEMASATMAAVMIYAIGRMNHLTDWLNWRWLQFFSGISYSLYLLHVPIGERFLRLGTRLGHGPVIAMGCVTGAFALSVAAAWVLNRLVERPGIELGKRLRKWDAPANVAI